MSSSIDLTFKNSPRNTPLTDKSRTLNMPATLLNPTTKECHKPFHNISTDDEQCKWVRWPLTSDLWMNSGRRIGVSCTFKPLPWASEDLVLSRAKVCRLSVQKKSLLSAFDIWDKDSHLWRKKNKYKMVNRTAKMLWIILVLGGVALMKVEGKYSSSY